MTIHALSTRRALGAFAGAAALALCSAPALAQMSYIDQTAPPDQYAAPADEYAQPPADQYAPPADQYAPPADQYAPPADQYAPPAPSYVADEITVYGSRIHEHEEGGTVTASKAVYVGDLDLSRHSGRHEARERIRHAANEVCDRLSNDYPSYGDDGNCVPDAMNGAMRQVRLVAYEQGDDDGY